jgi:CHAT domain-containing protein
MGTQSLAEWLRSGCDPAAFPPIPSGRVDQRGFLAELARELALLEEGDLEKAVGILPALLGDRAEPAEVVRALDGAGSGALTVRRRLLIGELAVDFLIIDENWKDCLPRLGELIEAAMEAGLKDELAILLNYRGVCHYRLAEYPDARSDLEESLRFADQIDSDRWRARARLNLGLVHKEMGQLEEAAVHYKAALALAKRINDPRTLLACYLNIGNIYKELGRWREGRQALESGIELADKLGNKLESTRGLLNLGVLLLDQGEDLEGAGELLRRVIEEAGGIEAHQLASVARLNLGLALVGLDRPDEALEHLILSLEQAKAGSDPEGAWRARANMARAYGKLGKVAEAEGNFRAALVDFERLWRQLGTDRDRAEFQRNLQTLMADYVAYGLELRGPETAFARLARSKGRALRQAMVGQGEASGSMPSDEEKLLRAIRLGLGKRRGSLILDYFLSKGGLKVFACDSDSVTVHDSPVSEEGIRAELKEFSTEMGLFVASREYRLANWGMECEAPEALRRLGAALIEPVRERIVSARHLLIVPMGILHHVPYMALSDAEGRYLVESHAISILPSSDFLSLSPPEETRRPGRVVALRGMAEGLVEVEAEVRALQSLLGDALEVAGASGALKVEGLKGLGRLVEGADAVHFVGHAEFDHSDPYASSLKLAGGENLRVSDLLEGEVSFEGVRMVSLAACETGKGEVLSGDEVIGLARSFLAAGAGCLITSLWKVSDEATRKLIPAVYKYWLEGETPAWALRSAVLDMLAEHRVHPYFFAPFQVMGG